MVTPTATSTVATPSLDYIEMALGWALIHDLKAGTQRMRDAGEKWLPKEECENDAQYKIRLARSFLFNGVQRAIDELLAKPFTKPVTVHEGLPGSKKTTVPPDHKTRLDLIETNADREGTDLTQFARGMFDDLLTHGITHILVDMPPVKVAGQGDAQLQDVRPYFVNLKADKLFAWRWKVRNGARVVTEVRYLECVSEATGDFGETRVEQIRRWTEDVIQVWRKDSQSGDWKLADERPNELKKVPIVTVQTKRDRFMFGTSPLRDVADVNCAHWQSQSDQRNILRFSRAAILWRSGVTQDEAQMPVAIGPGASHASSVPGADMKFVEHGGKAIEAGAKDEQDLVDKMAALTLEPMLSKSGDPTATAKAIDEGRANSLIHQWIRALEAALKTAYRLAAEWSDTTIPDDWKGVDIFSDFGLSIRASEDIRNLIEIRKAREITRETFLTEIKRRGLLSDTLNVQDEAKKVEQEGPDLSALASLLPMAGPGTAKPPGGGAPTKPAERAAAA